MLKIIGKTLLFCDTHPEAKFRPPSTSKWAKGSHKPNFDPPCVFSFCPTTALQLVENTVQKWGSPKFWKNAFCEVHFSSGAKQILETRCITQHVFLVDRLRDFYGFSNAHTLMFFDLPKRGLKPTKGTKSRSRDGPESKFRSPGPSKAAHANWKGSQKAAIPSFGRRKGPRASRPPLWTISKRASSTTGRSGLERESTSRYWD